MIETTIRWLAVIGLLVLAVFQSYTIEHSVQVIKDLDIEIDLQRRVMKQSNADISILSNELSIAKVYAPMEVSTETWSLTREQVILLSSELSDAISIIDKLDVDNRYPMSMDRYRSQLREAQLVLDLSE